MNLPTILNILLTSFLELVSLVGVLAVDGFILGALGRFTQRFLTRAFGAKGILLTAWIGTPVHELGHLLQCFIWGHRVTNVKLLQLNDPNGVLGYVEHHYNPRSLYHQVGLFFIGLGPIFSGVGFLILGMYFLIPNSYQDLSFYILYEFSLGNGLQTISETLWILTKSIFTFNNVLNPMFWIYLILAVCVSAHISLSKSDIRGATKGVLAIYLFLTIINGITTVIGLNSTLWFDKLMQYNGYLIAFSSMAIFFSLLALVCSYLVWRLKTITQRFY
ncbi:hypothetical protein M3181_17385 [Mesobacillus maritimus]|uniref:hypothetical protein n=1 Tax=Mesobacillus maritimus TaxID=1643336 RepID=UPI00203C46B1|nr:hypothetical protein [Mesobacillus maritimus]MCM3670734.1 hypothetical protein [Mesobacillus maritimus]